MTPSQKDQLWERVNTIKNGSCFTKPYQYLELALQHIEKVERELREATRKIEELKNMVAPLFKPVKLK